VGEVNARRAWRAGHSLSLVTEMHRRAGSLKVVRPVWNPELISQEDGEATGRQASTAGYAATLTADLDWGPTTCAGPSPTRAATSSSSNSRRRRSAAAWRSSPLPPSSTPPRCRRPQACRGCWRSPTTSSTTPGRLGDASLDLPGLAEAVAPTSTITGDALIHAAWADAAEKLVAAGHVPEVWGSVNRAPSIPDARSS
jgi:hypothetical protein